MEPKLCRPVILRHHLSVVLPFSDLAKLEQDSGTVQTERAPDRNFTPQKINKILSFIIIIFKLKWTVWSQKPPSEAGDLLRHL